MADLEQPGCFGFVVCYEPDGDFCAACNLKGQCAEVVAERRTALEKLLAGGVLPLRRGPLKRAEKPVTDAPKTEPEPTPKPKEELPVTEEKKTRGGSAPKRYSPGEFSKKAAQLDESLTKLKIDVVGALRQGRNPMDGIERLTYFKIACNALLQDRTLNRKRVVTDFHHYLGWNERTAASHLSIVANYFVAKGILAVDGDEYIWVAR